VVIFLQQPTRRTRTHTRLHRRIAQIPLVGDANAGREAHRPQHAVHRPGPGYVPYLGVNYIVYLLLLLYILRNIEILICWWFVRAVKAYEEDPLVYHGPVTARMGHELLKVCSAHPPFTCTN
jgi:hypothetical protein